MEKENDNIVKVARTDDKDWFLQSLVDIVDNEAMSFGITLNVSGFLVSGNLINGKEYFEGFGSDFASGLVDADSPIKDAFAKYGEIYSSDKKQLQPIYIHIKDARFFNTNGNPIPGNKGVWWRGCISRVDGFSLGSLN